MLKRVIILFLTFIGLIAGRSVVYAQIPQISTSLTWLNSAQTTTGNWPGVETNEYHSTAAALDAVYALEPTSPEYTAALQWMNVQMESPTDYLSRRIIALKRAGMDATSEIEGLFLYRNTSGSWGTTEGFDGNVLDIIDTALALQALKAANYPDLSIVNTALAYLTSAQSADGGWGFYKGDASNVYMTAIVSATLQLFPQTTTLATAVGKATSYLLAHQNTDGGFGSSPSTVCETSLAYAALVSAGADAAALGNAVNYLMTTQASNGSWNDDPYSTALALQALAKVKPNLTVSSITLSNPMPREGEETTITATIRNAGYEDTTDFVVRFFLGDPASGGVQIGSDQIISLIAVGSSSQVAITQSFSGTGGKTILYKGKKRA